jgi:hypothetical protein
MPTIQKPQLHHVPFCWHQHSEEFHAELRAQRPDILEKSGFTREFGSSGSAPGTSYELESDAFILELSGILSRAAAIKVDGGYKAANKVIATLRAIEKDPTLVFKAAVEPEALAMLESNFRLASEEPGTFWFLLDRSDAALICDPQCIGRAASAAIRQLRTEVRRGRRADFMLDYLGDRLLACYLRFNDTATRHSIASDGERAQAEAGPYFEFLKLVVAPLGRFLGAQGLGVGTTPISLPELARRSLQRRGQPLIRRVAKFTCLIGAPNSSHKRSSAGLSAF